MNISKIHCNQFHQRLRLYKKVYHSNDSNANRFNWITVQLNVYNPMHFNHFAAAFDGVVVVILVCCVKPNDKFRTIGKLCHQIDAPRHKQAYDSIVQAAQSNSLFCDSEFSQSLNPILYKVIWNGFNNVALFISATFRLKWRTWLFVVNKYN